MPELPEVETTRRGLLPHVVGRRIHDVVVRNRNLRWPVPRDLPRRLRGERVLAIRRRGKYLLFDCRDGHLLVHLGMSGRLSLVARGEPPRAHDHVDLQLEGPDAVRLTDPRRFGAMLWTLHRLAQGRRVAVKHFLMNARVVTGVGNIYASEALFRAGIHPLRSVARISPARWARLAAAVRETLERALAAGGTTLRDYASLEGRPGEFGTECAVYGRGGLPCEACGTPIRALRQGQRSTFYCPECQR
jgi:formamidopyrimidine-DNA glycosylase